MKQNSGDHFGLLTIIPLWTSFHYVQIEPDINQATDQEKLEIKPVG